MLNKNQSKNWNYLKYALVIPALIAFIFAFQMEVIAQVKTNTKQGIEKKSVIIDFIITKNTTNKEIEEQCGKLNKLYNLNLTFFNIKRNSNGEIINIDGQFKDKTGSGSCNQSENPIKPFRFFYNVTNKEIGFDMDMSISKYGVINKNEKSAHYKLPATIKTTKVAPPPPPALPPTIKGKVTPPPPPALPPTVSTIKFLYPTEKNQIIASTSNNKTVSINEPIIIIDGVKADSKTTVNSLNKEENDKTYFQINEATSPPIIIMNGVKINSISSMNEINPDAIKNLNVLKGESAIKKYGENGKYGVIEITTNTLDPSKIIKTPKK